LRAKQLHLLLFAIDQLKDEISGENEVNGAWKRERMEDVEMSESVSS